MSKLPLIVILGRPNVGKSTLFNRIVGSRRALVGNEPGMTRDRLESVAEWGGKRFNLVDTGGIVPQDRDRIASEILRHAQMAIERAAHLILVVDGREGVLPLDQELCNLLRRTGKRMSLAVNKIDLPMHTPLAAEFASLGVEDTFPVSAEHGLGVDQLIEHVTADLQAPEEFVAGPEAPVRIAIIGRPNVGKSTLLNRLAGQERSIVTPVAGTTRDAVDVEVERDGARYVFVDTAGIRRKGKTKLLAEKLSVIQARKHLEQADIALFIVDAQEGVAALDTHIAGYAHESRRSVILVVNKWDAIQKGPTVTRDYTQELRRRMKFLDYAPIAFISALNGQRVESLAFTNRLGKLHFSVERFLENRIRERFGFIGCPIVIKSRKRT
ncbi:MAG: ribosome biogenesis GTPase Der [Acidobacteriota bacterium]